MEEPKVFLSYAREDRSAARRVCHSLRTNGADIWFDEDSLIGGQRWLATITKEIQQSDFFLALLSKSSVSKQGVVQKEMREALKVVETLPPDRIFIVPARLEECEPTFDWFREIHWVDLFRDWTTGIEQILEAILPERYAFADPPVRTPFEEALSSSPVSAEPEMPQHIRVAGLLHDALDSFQHYAEQRNVAVNLRDESRGAMVYADPRLLRLVLYNLLHNAVKYAYSTDSKEGGVTVTSDVVGTDVRISVEDMGIGIPKDEIASQSIFHAGYRSRVAQGISGTGMGLYVAREIVEGANGRIRVASKPLRGSLGTADYRSPYVTTFTIHLPVALIDDRASGATRNEEA